jgi:hypothetical protein
MVRQGLFETGARNVSQIETFIAGLVRTAAPLDDDIKREEERR